MNGREWKRSYQPDSNVVFVLRHSDDDDDNVDVRPLFCVASCWILQTNNGKEKEQKNVEWSSERGMGRMEWKSVRKTSVEEDKKLNSLFLFGNWVKVNYFIYSCFELFWMRGRTRQSASESVGWFISLLLACVSRGEKTSERNQWKCVVRVVFYSIGNKTVVLFIIMDCRWGTFFFVPHARMPSVCIQFGVRVWTLVHT